MHELGIGHAAGWAGWLQNQSEALAAFDERNGNTEYQNESAENRRLLSALVAH